MSTLAHLRTYIELMPDAIVISDAEGRIWAVNSEAKALVGYSESELVGQVVEMLMPQQFQSQHVQHRRGFVASAVGHRRMGSGTELYGRRRDGTDFPADISLEPITDGEQSFYIAVVRDVTELRQLAEELKTTNERARAIGEAT